MRIFPLPFKIEIIFKKSNLNKVIDFGNGVDNFREINQMPIDFKDVIQQFWYLAKENIGPAQQKSAICIAFSNVLIP